MYGNDDEQAEEEVTLFVKLFERKVYIPDRIPLTRPQYPLPMRRRDSMIERQ